MPIHTTDNWTLYNDFIQLQTSFWCYRAVAVMATASMVTLCQNSINLEKNNMKQCRSVAFRCISISMCSSVNARLHTRLKLWPFPYVIRPRNSIDNRVTDAHGWLMWWRLWWRAEDTSKYWTYKGSFTTPPCFETVTWILMQETISVTSRTVCTHRWAFHGSRYSLLAWIILMTMMWY